MGFHSPLFHGRLFLGGFTWPWGLGPLDWGLEP